MTRFALICMTVSVLASSRPAPARALPDWPYDKLFKEADVVVVAEAKETNDSDDKSTGIPMAEHLLAQTTVLKLQGTLKGKITGDEIKVLHFRLKDGVKIENGPCLVAFRTKSVRIVQGGKAGASAPPHYLLFLKARSDGRYEPVSGQYDPALSVREMYRP
jgi:hypothetical protein